MRILAESTADLPTPLGEAPPFQAMLAHVSEVAPLDRPVLVVGERGTGKELVASRLAFLSGRWDRPFVKLNCAALTESLLDSELFGHEAGAFTGATRRRVGRFELADSGTLFLDEIANASLAVQEKVLRVIEYGTFERVGSNEAQQIDVRVIAATNVDLPSRVAAGTFRADLLDRLAFDVITVPPLRERRDDIRLLAEHFATRMASELRRGYFPGFSATVLQVLTDHPWPGNVRELRNVVERSVCRMKLPTRPLQAVILDPFDSPYRPRAQTPPLAAPAPAAPTEPSGDFTAQVRAFEAGLLRQALEETRHNQKAAAQRLGLTYHQLRHYLKAHRLLPAATPSLFPPPLVGGVGGGAGSSSGAEPATTRRPGLRPGPGRGREAPAPQSFKEPGSD